MTRGDAARPGDAGRRGDAARRVAVVSLGALLLVLAAACGDDGRARPTIPPPPGPAPTGSEDPVTAALATGLDIYTAQCTVCHGTGEENDLAPSMRADLLDTFSSCADQNEFVSIGAEAWPDDTYGDDASPIGEYDLVMAGYRFALSEDEIAAVNFWIRVELAGVPTAEAATGCGITD